MIICCVPVVVLPATSKSDGSFLCGLCCSLSPSLSPLSLSFLGCMSKPYSARSTFTVTPILFREDQRWNNWSPWYLHMDIWLVKVIVHPDTNQCVNCSNNIYVKVSKIVANVASMSKEKGSWTYTERPPTHRKRNLHFSTPVAVFKTSFLRPKS